MTIRAILKQKGREVVSVPPTLPLEELTRLLHARRIGAVLVQDTTGALLGIVSERDVVGAIAKLGQRALTTKVEQLMTRELQTIAIGASVEQAMAKMTAGRFRHLPVLDGNTLVGVVSIGDIVKARIDQQEQEVDSLKAYVAGAA
jgi:CBS domain-containing protein